MKVKGIGIGSMWYGVGNTAMPNPSAAFIEVHPDSTVTVLTGCTDIGQGSTTVLAQIVAEVLGVEYDKVHITSADTAVTPEGGATSASRQTYISGNACKKAAEMARNIMFEVAADMLQTDSASLELRGQEICCAEGDNGIEVSEVIKESNKRGTLIVGSGSYNPPTTSLDSETMQGTPYGMYAFGTHVAEVEVNTSTGEVKVLKIIAAHDLGKMINPQRVEGQIEGGCMMGMGFALLEELEVKNGIIKNAGFSDYLIYTSLDLPDIYPVILEEGDPEGPFGAKGIGEPALIPTAPAILAAIKNATGIRFKVLPVTQERVIEQLVKRKKERSQADEGSCN